VTVELLSVADIQQELQRRQLDEHQQAAIDVAKTYKYIERFTSAAEGLIEVVQNTENRLMLGIPALDQMTRGIGRGEMAMVTGRSHSGKTQVILHAVCHNAIAGKRILFLTPDEVSELVLAKMISMHYGINAEIVEEGIRTNDADMIRLVRHAANHDFKDVIVVDDSISIKQAARALDEAQDMWGAPADLVVLDYLELLSGDADGLDGVVAKSQGLKRWSKEADIPLIVLHQSSRTSAPRGQSGGLNSGKYGGEQESIFVFDVWRKREDESLDEFDRQRWRNAVSVGLFKNKRPPSKKGTVDLFLDPATGAIRTLRDEDMAVPGQTMTTAAEAAAARIGTF